MAGKKATECYEPSAFYERVKKLVKKNCGLNLGQFLKKNGVNHFSYYSLQKQNNFPRADVAQRIANALGVSLDYLVSGKDHELGLSAEEFKKQSFPYPEEFKIICDALMDLEEDQKKLIVKTTRNLIRYFQGAAK